MSKIEIPNPKEHFIRYDGLENVMYDVTFSIFKKYTCQAGCKICYIGNDFLPKESFKKHIPISSAVNNKSYKEKLLNFLSYFQLAATIDDLRYVRDQHPDLYKFYLECGSHFWLSSMTDNAIFRHLPIIEEDIRFKGLREISMSEKFLYQVNFSKLLDAFTRIERRSHILKIKVILSGTAGIAARANALTAWCRDHEVLLEKQFEHGIAPVGASSLAGLPNTRYSDDASFTEDRTYTESSDIYPIHSESIFLQYDDFYSELKSATREDRSAPFAHLNEFYNPQEFLARVLEGKRADYARYAESMQDKNNDYYRYFKYVADNLIVKRHYNFLPRIMLRPDSAYYQKLLALGRLVDTKYGLVDPSATTILPPYTFRHEPDLLSN